VDDADARCPGGIAYGRKVAAPPFRRIAERLIQYLDVKPVDPVRTVGGIGMQTASR
jgi:hypothetical protein